MRITKPALFLTGFYVALIVWWLTIQYSGITDTLVNFAFAFALGLLPLIGGFWGLAQAKKYGMLKSVLGKALTFLSSGLITWGFGEMIWSYYNLILHVEVPYPSWADASFILSWPLWTIGMVFLSAATGAKFGLRSRNGRLLLFIIPLAVIILSYYLLVQVARQGSFELTGGALKIFFDLVYPIWDVIILTVTILVYGLSVKSLGGRLKFPVIITLLGFVVNYFADFSFSYTTTIETFYNGSLTDLLFTTAMFLLSFGVNSLDIRE
ncbi:MAG TPA: hypothetical protein VJ179_04045 [Patescibacteria group bacterium]|nr:hypothetical protein [Patescibacteria group bacterium]